MPGVGEKGYTDVYVTIRKDGGHSSIPTDHTGIGIAAEIITEIEAEQYPTYLADENPFLGLLQCGAAHGEEFPSKLKKLLGKRSSNSGSKKHHCHHKKQDLLALEAAKLGKPIQYLMQTSQAVDVISGGVKTNALPERTGVTINHRINIGDTPEVVWNKFTSIAAPIAKKYNLTLHAFDGISEEANSISISAADTTLQVAPVTPTDVDGVTPYSILAATTRALYGEEIIVAPGMMTGNTDTRYYWPITKHIFRYGPGWDPAWDKGLAGVHTVNEKISVVNHLNMVKWFTLFVRNFDDAELED
jgi:Gly-Xaa carboxypeptidase